MFGRHVAFANVGIHAHAAGSSVWHSATVEEELEALVQAAVSAPFFAVPPDAHSAIDGQSEVSSLSSATLLPHEAMCI